VEKNSKSRVRGQIGGWAGSVFGWANARLGKLRKSAGVQPRLALIERITLAPRQSLALVEAEGRRILVAVSAEGGPAFFALDQGTQRATVRGGTSRARISW
jgi:flagellar biogenesis protein FliO